jgi:hypothetical protein
MLPGQFTIQAAAATAAGEKPKNPRFALSAYNGGPMRLNGWTHPVVVDMQGLSVAATKLPVYANHDTEDIDSLLGQTSTVTIMQGKLAAEGDVTGRSPTCQAVLDHAANGFEWQASIGATVDQTEFIGAGKTCLVNGQSVAGPVTIARKSTLGEISFVALGADTSTSARIAAKAAQEKTPMNEFEKWLQAEYNLAAADLDTDQTAKFTAKYEASKKPPAAPPAKTEATTPPVAASAAAPPDPVAELRAKTGTEMDRIATVQALAKDHPKIAAQAVKEGWGEDKTKLEVLQASRPIAGAPAVHVHGCTLSAQVIEAAALQTGGYSGDRLLQMKFPEQVIDASTRFRGIGPRSMIELACQMEGVALPWGKDISREWLKAAFSTISVPNILSNLMNKFLLEGYMNVDRAWSLIAKRGPANDFKPQNRLRLTEDFTFEPLGPDGEIKHGQLGEQKYVIQVDTYAKMFGLSRQQIVNDDLSAFADLPRRFGRGAGLAVNKKFWTTWLANAYTKTDGTAGTFFAAGNNNYISGATTNLCFAALGQLYTNFLAQTDPFNNPLGIEPKILLVPSNLKPTAMQLMQSQQLIPALVSTSGAPSSLPQQNIFRDMWTVVSTPYLQNPTYTGYSTTAWYLLADPTALHTIEAAFLNGQEMPTVERAEANFDELGIQFRGWIDFGIALGEPRAAQMSKGAA